MQFCNIRPEGKMLPRRCAIWSDTGRPEIYTVARASVYAGVSAEGECAGTVPHTNYANETTCQVQWRAAARPLCESEMLRDPNNIFSECFDDYGQGSCEEAGGEWRRTSQLVDPRGSEQANTCILNGAGCYVNAGGNFDPDASVLYDIDHPFHSDTPGFHETYTTPLTGPCEDAYPNTCQLSAEGNAFLGCAQISRPGTPKVSVDDVVTGDGFFGMGGVRGGGWGRFADFGLFRFAPRGGRRGGFGWIHNGDNLHGRGRAEGTGGAVSDSH